jgi:hypothetical protein
MNNQHQSSTNVIHEDLKFWMNDIIMSRKKQLFCLKTWQAFNIKQFKLVRNFQELLKQIRLKQLIESIKQYKLVTTFQELAQQIKLKHSINHIKDFKIIKKFYNLKVHKLHESSTASRRNWTQRARDFYNNPIINQVDSLSKQQNFRNYETTIQNYFDHKPQLINKINNLKINTGINDLSEINNNNWRNIKLYLTNNTSRGGGNDTIFLQNEATLLRRIFRFVLNINQGYINDYHDLCQNITLLGTHSILVAGIYDTIPCIYCYNHPKIKGLPHCGICKRK